MKSKWCIQCGRKIIKGRRLQMLCDLCLLAEYQKLKKDGKKEKEKEIK